MVDRVDEVGPAVSALAGLSQLSQGLVQEDEATIFVHGFTAKRPADAKVEVGKTGPLVRIATGPEFAADVRLCTNRPALRHYDAHQMKHEDHGQKFVIIRPDRFVYAACSSIDELQRAAKSMPQALTISTS